MSAYDIHHRRLLDSDRFTDGFRESIYARPTALFIDSGLYEVKGSDPSEAATSVETPLASWSPEQHIDTIESLDADVAAYIVNYDSTASYGHQIAEAQDFFGRFPRMWSDFLLKPPDGSRFHNVDQLRPHIADLRAFHVIGVTDRELGDSYLDKLTTLGHLRMALDEKEVAAPIHVFGSLDPLFSPLFFLAGAEIFDGLTWLRYAYREGVSVYRDAGVSTYRDADAVLKSHLTLRENERVARSIVANLDYLQQLRLQMKQVAATLNFNVFGAHARVAEDAYEALKTELRI